MLCATNCKTELLDDAKHANQYIEIRAVSPCGLMVRHSSPKAGIAGSTPAMDVFAANKCVNKIGGYHEQVYKSSLLTRLFLFILFVSYSLFNYLVCSSWLVLVSLFYSLYIDLMAHN